jgi:hypothetical protein
MVLILCGVQIKNIRREKYCLLRAWPQACILQNFGEIKLRTAKLSFFFAQERLSYYRKDLHLYLIPAYPMRAIFSIFLKDILQL